jgi:hypothetical protein
MLQNGNATVLGVAVGYFIWATWARWRYIALPYRSRLIGDLRDIVALTRRTHVGATGAVRADAVAAINELLGIAPVAAPVTPGPPAGGPGNPPEGELERTLRRPSFWRNSTWSAEMEEEAQSRIAAAQVHVPDLLAAEEVRARLIVARGWLSEYGNKAEFVALGQQIDESLGTATAAAAPRSQSARLLRTLAALTESKHGRSEQALDHNRALLGQALVQTYTTPGSPSELIWHRKTALVLVSGLTAIVLLSFFDHADVVLLFGATGGLLQRLWQLVYERDEKSSSPLYWSTLFLAPVAGALAAVGGLYLVSFLNVTHVFGSSISTHIGFRHDVIRSVGPANAGMAFLLGFSARLLGNLVSRSTAVATPASTVS